MKKIVFSLLGMIGFAIGALAGSITTNVSSLYHFKACYVHHSATAQWFLVSGSALTANVIITAPEHFEVSTHLNHFYGKTLTIPANGALASTKVFIRFSPESVGEKTGSVQVASAGSTTKTITVSGQGTAFTSLSTYYPSGVAYGASLKTQLYSAINAGAKSFSYGNLYAHYPSTDTYYDGTVWDVYSTKVDGPAPFTFSHGQKQCGTYKNEGDCYNREHIMPQSWFNEGSPMRADIHHVWPTDGKVNGQRGSYPFGEVSNPNYTSQQGAKRGSNSTTGYSSTVFEPLDEYKGDIARSLLYMAVRYENNIGNWSGNGSAGQMLAGNAFPAYKPWAIELLLKWHNQDPPSNREIIRNNYIGTAACQHNRNPFIDSPQYANRIWGGVKPLEPISIATNLSITDSTGHSFRLNFKSGNGFRRLVVIRPKGVNAIHPIDTIHYNANSTISTNAITGAQNYVVYNGTSSGVTISGLTPGAGYVINVYEYNGFYNGANYLVSSYATISTDGNVKPIEPPIDGERKDSVSINNFDAQLNTDLTIHVKWTVNYEGKAGEFNLLRSINNRPFYLIWSAPGFAHDSLVAGSYVDDTLMKNPEIHKVTYRLRYIGQNTSYIINTDTQQVVNTSTGLIQRTALVFDGIIYPVPFSNQLHIQLPEANYNYVVYTVSLTDILGKQQAIKQVEVNANNEVVLDGIGHLPTGIYLLNITNGSNHWQVKVNKQ